MGYLPGVKLAGRVIYYSDPITAKMKNEYSYTSTPSIWLHDVDRYKFTLYFNSQA